MSFIVSKVQKILSPLFKTPFGLCPALFFLYAKKTGVLNYFNFINFEPKQANILANDRLLSDLYVKSNFGEESQIVSKLYREIFAEFSEISGNQFNAVYKDIIETVIDNIANTPGRSMMREEFTQPKSLTNLVFALAEKLQPKRVFNPFAGTCSYALLPNIEQYYGQEINGETFLLAQVRLDAHGIDINSVHLEDSANINCFGDDMDCILCTPPFGLNIDFTHLTWRRYKSIYEFILFNFLDSPSLDKGVFILPASVCYDRRFFDLRKSFAERNALDMVIELPMGVFNNTSVKTVVLVVSKYRKTKEIRFIDATDCLSHFANISKGVSSFDLDTEKVLSLINNSSSDKVTTTSIDELFNKDCSWHAGAYISYVEELTEGQTLISVSDILELGININSSDINGLVLSPSDFFDHINGVFTDINPTKGTVTSSHKAYFGEHIVVSLLQNKLRLCKCNFEEPFFANQNQVAFTIREDSPIKNIDYIVYALLNSTGFSHLVSKFHGVNIRTTRQLARHILDCKIAVYLDVAKQDDIMSSCKDEYVSQRVAEFNAEQERLGIRTVSSDLSHMLGRSFDRIESTISSLCNENINSDLLDSLNSLNDNFKFMKRFITAFGADFSRYKMKPKEVEVNTFIKSYLHSWCNFGPKAFDINYLSNVLDDTTFVIDEDMLRILFDTILDNAYRHGFGNRESVNDSNNIVSINSSCVTWNQKEYILIEIKNNGKPFPQDFSLKKFISRGYFDGSTGNTGLGGNHVYSILKRHNGHLAISKTKTWSVIFELLIPVELYSETENFEIYGNDNIL